MGTLRERALGGAHVNHNNVQRYYIITLLLSALPVSTMSAPGTPDPAAAPGYMAAQQDHSPVTVHHHAVIPAPSTPVLPVHENAGLPIVNTDLTLRRASLGTPFYAEADAGLRDGPLEEPKGLLQDLSGVPKPRFSPKTAAHSGRRGRD